MDIPNNMEIFRWAEISRSHGQSEGGYQPATGILMSLVYWGIANDPPKIQGIFSPVGRAKSLLSNLHDSRDDYPNFSCFFTSISLRSLVAVGKGHWSTGHLPELIFEGRIMT